VQQSLLIEKYLLDLQRVSQELQAPVLDLACGRGRNGLYLLQHDIPVTFADINNEALEHVKLNIDKPILSKNQYYHAITHIHYMANCFPQLSFIVIYTARYLSILKPQ